MKRIHHCLVLVLILSCVAYQIVLRREAPVAPETSDAEAHNHAGISEEELKRDAAAQEALTQARISELNAQETGYHKRERAAAKTEIARGELESTRRVAWRSVISTNWDAFMELRRRAAQSSTQEMPCALCDGKGSMHFCILCRDNSGKCEPCTGSGLLVVGEFCPTCLGNGKCYLCFGTGKMLCPFCSDGTIMLKLALPSTEMPERRPRQKDTQRERRDEWASVPNSITQPVGVAPPAQSPEVAHTAAAESQLPASIFDGKKQYLLLGLVCVLVVVLTTRTLIRHKREAEIRALAGNYLADGTEAARFEMPALFASPLAAPAAGFAFDNGFADAKQAKDKPANHALQAFFALAPERIMELRKLLSNFGKAFDDAERQQILTKLFEMVCLLKSEAGSWDLRPVWQMSSALELLLKRLIEKGKEATPSTLGSVTNAVELLGDLCVPGVRPDLIITPPISVLAVDDDPSCLRAVMFALQKAEMTPDLAEDGEKAVALATQKYYDVVFMDIEMPGIDGLTACSEIRKTAKNANTPVVFVTVRSDFQTRAESLRRGGSDLMAKPFLMFEITVKALTYAMRKRLQLQQSMTKQTRGTGSLSEAGVVTQTSDSAATANSQTVPGASAPAVPGLSSRDGREMADDLDGDLFSQAPSYLAATRQMLEDVSAEPDQEKRQEGLGRIYTRIHALADLAKLAQLSFTGRTSAALEALLKRLHQNPKAVSPSTLNTVANALSVLESLCVRGVEQKLAHHPPFKILVVEDEPIARRAVVGTLQLAFEKPDSANDGFEAFNLAAQKTYDVIFSDIEMPHMSGFGLCTRIREGGPNRNTPIVFITSHIGFEVRTQAVQSGGSDFIAKPFLPIELTVKTLTYALEGRLRKINASPVLVSPLTVAAVAESNPPPELLPAVND